MKLKLLILFFIVISFKLVYPQKQPLDTVNNVTYKISFCINTYVIVKEKIHNNVTSIERVSIGKYVFEDSTAFLEDSITKEKIILERMFGCMILEGLNNITVRELQITDEYCDESKYDFLFK